MYYIKLHYFLELLLTDHSNLIPSKIMQQDRQVFTHPLLGWINMEQVLERRKIATSHGKWSVGELSNKTIAVTLYLLYAASMLVPSVYLINFVVVADVGNSHRNTWTCSI